MRRLALAACLGLAAAAPAFAQQAKPVVMRAPTDAPVHAPYGPRENPITKARSTHAGIDYATPKGAPVLAPADGEVVYAGWYGGYGRVVMLDHGGELVTLLGGHPSLKIGSLLETEQHDIGDILRESLEHEKDALAAYYSLLKLAEGKSVLIEEYARDMIAEEELHLDEVNKMLRKPGDVTPYKG